jgi:PGF-pre-PGF domain-containing protein
MLLLTISANAASWEIETLDSSIDGGYHSSLAFNSSGNAGISYYDYTNTALKYAYYDGIGWQNVTIDNLGDVGWYTSIAVDSLDNTGISYHDVDNSNLKYAYYDGSNWQTEIVDSTGNIGYYTSIAFDSLNNPCISYYDISNHDLKYAYHDGSNWQTETVDDSGTDVGIFTSLAFDSSGKPTISYFDSATYDLKYAYYDGSNWQTEVVDSIGNMGAYPSLAFNSSGTATISYYDNTNHNLKYAYYDGSNWQNTTIISSTDDVGLYCSLAFDSSDNAMISYYDNSNFALRYAYYDGSVWQNELINSVYTVEQPTSIALSSSGKIGISYTDYTNGKLKYASLSSVGTLPVNSSVPGAWIYANGVNQSAQTNSTISLAAGTYNITVMQDYYEVPANQSVTIAEGANSGIDFTLVPMSPISNFSTNVTSGTAPLSVSFSDLSSNGPAMWNFSFGDGAWHNTTDANAADNTHVFSSPGEYTVNLSVSARGLTNISSTSISVYDTVPVNSSVAGSWVYVDGVNQSVQTNATLSLGSGTYNVTVVKDYYTTPVNQSVTVGFSNSVLDFSPVPASPISNFSTNVSSGTISLSVSFTDLSTIGPEMWNLSFGDGSWHNTTDAAAINTSHVYSTPGAYIANLSVSARGLTNISSTSISVYDTVPVNSSVAGSWVYVDGINHSVQTNTTLSLAAGTYNVTVVKDYYTTPANQSVTIGFSNSVLDFAPVAAPPFSNFSTNVSSGTAPLIINFTDHSTLDSEMWNLSFGDGTWHNTTDVNAVNTSHVYSNAGAYTATLSVTARGLTNTSSTNIDVLGALPVNSSISGAWIYANGANQSVQTNGTITLPVGTYNISVLKNYYETPANQSVTITGSNSVIDFSLVAIPPVSNFSTNVSSGSIPLNVSFTDLSTTGPEMWNLSFGDGIWYNTTDASAANTTHLYSTPGEYTANLSVSARGLTNVSSTSITVFDTLSVNSSIADTWVYADGVNQSVQANATLSLASGTYNVTVVKEYYETPANQSVTIGFSNPVLYFSPVPISPVSNFSTNVTSGIAALSVSFTDLSTTGPEMWNLSFGDGTWHNTTDISAVNTTYVYSNPGTYTAILSVSARGLTNISSTDVNVSGVVPVNSSVANSWIYVDGVNQSVQTNNSLTLPAGTYNVTVMKDYYATPANQSVTIAASNSVLDFTQTPLSPIAGISASSTSGTVPLTVIFTDTSTTGPEMWNLSFGDGTWHNTTDASNVSTTHVFSSIGTYNVTLNVSARGLSNSTLTTITVNAVPPSSPTGSSSGTRVAVSQGHDPAIVGATVSSVMRITGDTEAEYDFSNGNTPVLGISFDAKKDGGLVVAKVQVLSDAPAGVPNPSGKSYQMMSIDVGSEGTISKDNADNIMIRFKVSKEWIKENDIDVSTIRMTRYHGGGWQDLPTYQEREEDEFIYFTAETPGFSIFNVVGDKEGADIIGERETSVIAEEELESIETKDTPGFTALAGIIFLSFAFVLIRKFD